MLRRRSRVLAVEAVAVGAEQVRGRAVDRERDLVTGLEHAGADVFRGNGATIGKSRIDETALAEPFARFGRAVIAYGEAASVVEADLAGRVPVERVDGDFDAVMERARELARVGDAVLLSPACSSCTASSGRAFHS